MILYLTPEQRAAAAEELERAILSIPEALAFRENGDETTAALTAAMCRPIDPAPPSPYF